MQAIVKNTRIAGICTAVPPEKMIVSDMCRAAAERLMEKLGWEKDSIELLVLITQGPDVPLPATACLIQNRLGLPTSCAAFDVNLGCSGYVYGIWMVSQMLTSMSKGRALLMVGD